MAIRLEDWDGTAAGAFGQSWAGLSEEIGPVRGVRRATTASVAGKGTFLTGPKGVNYRVDSNLVRMDLEVRADPEFQRFLLRLDKLSKPDKRAFRKALRDVTRQTILPAVRKEIPEGPPEFRGRYAASRRRFYLRYKPRRLRSTAEIFRVYDDRIIISVGTGRHKRVGPRGQRYGLWHAAIVHSRWHAFFPAAFRKSWRDFNDAIADELRRMMKYLAHGRGARLIDIVR